MDTPTGRGRRERRALAARPAPARPAPRAHVQLGLRCEHAQRAAAELLGPYRPCAIAGVGPVPGEADHRGVWRTG
jgi:hypothetical protein